MIAIAISTVNLQSLADRIKVEHAYQDDMMRRFVDEPSLEICKLGSTLRNLSIERERGLWDAVFLLGLCSALRELCPELTARYVGQAVTR